MRALGLDVGTRRIGVALSDPLGISAQRLTVLARQGDARDAGAVGALVDQHRVDVVVVGLPLTTQGKRGAQAQRIDAFADRLRGQLSVPVELVDERFTTQQGERALLETDTPRRKRKALIDQVAAQLLLQQFLDIQHDTRH